MKGTHIGVGVIDEGVQQLDGLPHAHARPCLPLEVFPRLDVVGHSLLLYRAGQIVRDERALESCAPCCSL